MIEKKLFFCFLVILSSMMVSSFKSIVVLRSLTYSLIYIFSFCIYFLVPFNFMWFGEESKILKYYVSSFFIIGSYAFMQFFFSLFGVILPFTTQEIIFARGSAFALEPSFYALYSIPFIAFLNSRNLFLNSHIRNSSFLLYLDRSQTWNLDPRESSRGSVSQGG